MVLIATYKGIPTKVELYRDTTLSLYLFLVVGVGGAVSLFIERRPIKKRSTKEGGESVSAPMNISLNH